MMQAASQTQTTAPTISTPADAIEFANRLIDAMNALLALIEDETALVRAGKVAEAIKLDARKGELSRAYVAAISQLKANRSYFAASAPDVMTALHRHHDTFRAMLQVNLTVLATAHAVSEGIVRGVNGELQKKNAPQTYTAAGAHSAAGQRHAAPLSVSRTL